MMDLLSFYMGAHVMERMNNLEKRNAEIEATNKDLLDALIEITDWYESVTNVIDSPIIDRARAAIAKAKGECSATLLVESFFLKN
jgi:hypothetical protein